MSHYDETKNRFNPCNRFIGDIENGLRYPFACYTKAESDERYAPKSVETDVTALAEAVNSKASQSDLTAFETQINNSIADIQTALDGKANASELTAIINAIRELQAAVSQKADESECVAIRARLDALEVNAIRITNFTASSTSYEKGASATVTLNWSLNKTATTQKINNQAVTGSTATYTGVTDNTTYTLEVSDGDTNDVQSVSVNFANNIYYGVATDLSSVNNLESIVSDSISRRFTVTASSGQYIIYAIPARLRNATFYVDSWEGGFDAPVEQTITNSNGYSETYKVYKSTNANLGTTTVEVREA
jgi:hypothetical protein